LKGIKHTLQDNAIKIRFFWKWPRALLFTLMKLLFYCCIKLWCKRTNLYFIIKILQFVFTSCICSV
jgi:hypothetical protein